MPQAAVFRLLCFFSGFDQLLQKPPFTPVLRMLAWRKSGGFPEGVRGCGASCDFRNVTIFLGGKIWATNKFTKDSIKLLPIFFGGTIDLWF